MGRILKTCALTCEAVLDTMLQPWLYTCDLRYETGTGEHGKQFIRHKNALQKKKERES